MPDSPFRSHPTSAVTSAGGIAPSEDGYLDLGYARLDTDRARRTGDAEVVYGKGKAPQQVLGALRALHERHPERAVLATRLDPAAQALLAAELPQATQDTVAGTAVLGPLPEPAGLVLVISAGTSDAPVAAEAAVTARVHGAGVERLDDVGVAGIHRLLSVSHRLRDADALVVVAGMEGALPSVVGGLSGVPLVAVPTSTGYGTGAGGYAALLGMLNSCSPGIVVVNVDNGYGAAVHAARIARRAAARTAE
ncbi:MAG TPA: nickel pincer cofactor biosynthesis protein LarB [Actinomycetales bacterium]|nr:nickel pincer cofactor biosynthesis protein LarB [Actinomycetales bacterium]